MKKAALFVAVQPDDQARRYLLDIAEQPGCGIARSQAINSFEAAWDADAPADVREGFVSRLKSLGEAARGELRESRDEAQRQAVQNLDAAIKAALAVIGGAGRAS